MTNLYLPGAKVIPGRDGGTMLGGPAKVVWHTTENDPTKTSATNVAKYLVGSGNTVHLVWNPVSGETVAMIPANLAGRGLENRAGGVETNRAGRVVIQIEVVGRASQPFTDGPCNGLAEIQAWLTSLGIPSVWAGTEDRSVANWAKGGHFGHVDVPENSHTDPGNVNKTKLASTPTPTPVPAPPIPLEEIMKPFFIRAKTGAIVIVGPTGVRGLTPGQWQTWVNLGAVLEPGMSAMDPAPFAAVVASLGGLVPAGK